MVRKTVRSPRKGSVLVEYALLIAGIVLVSVVAIAVLGHKLHQIYGVMAAIMPSAHTDDNKPIEHTQVIPFQDDGSGKLVLKSDGLVSGQGVDRMENVLGPNGGELLIKD